MKDIRFWRYKDMGDNPNCALLNPMRDGIFNEETFNGQNDKCRLIPWEKDHKPSDDIWMTEKDLFKTIAGVNSLYVNSYRNIVNLSFQTHNTQKYIYDNENTIREIKVDFGILNDNVINLNYNHKQLYKTK